MDLLEHFVEHIDLWSVAAGVVVSVVNGSVQAARWFRRRSSSFYKPLAAGMCAGAAPIGLLFICCSLGFADFALLAQYPLKVAIGGIAVVMVALGGIILTFLPESMRDRSRRL